ncbi:MAG: cadherin-like beta sandwich domain-containing protein [Nitrospira sp.]
MRRNLVKAGQRFVAALLLALGPSFYGCKDTVSISDDVAVPLSSLTVTPGALQPAFFSNTTNYKVNAPNSATSVTVTASPKSSTVTMTINGVVTAAGQGRTILLGVPGSTTTILIELLSQTGGETTYTITVTRLLSNDDNLSALSVTPGSLVPAFASSSLDYTVNVATNVTSVTVSATKSDSNAVMSGSVTAGAGVKTGQATIPLDGPGTSKVVSIIVTAPNGDSKTYTITVNRLSGDNNLSALTITPGSLNPPFAAATLDYTVDVATTVTEVTVTATKSDPNAVISGDVPNQGQATIPLDGPGTSKVISIIVTAPNGDSKTYTITINRLLSSDNNLSALTITPGSLNPPFAAATLDYTVDVATTVTEVTVTATKSDPNAVISGDVPNQGQATIPLDGPGTSKVISIIVTAPNGVSKTYTITVTRAAPASDNNLAALTVTGGPLVPDFTPSTTDYTVAVPFSVDSVIVSATKSDANAVMSGSVNAGSGQATGQATIDLPIPLLPTPVTITVMAPNGDFKIYSLTITRALF